MALLLMAYPDRFKSYLTWFVLFQLFVVAALFLACQVEAIGLGLGYGGVAVAAPAAVDYYVSIEQQ